MVHDELDKLGILKPHLMAKEGNWDIVLVPVYISRNMKEITYALLATASAAIRSRSINMSIM
jgi:hypothetical protein